MVDRSHKRRFTSGLAKEKDVPTILSLQHANLAKNLRVSERRRQGFVGIETTEVQLEELVRNGMVVVVREGDCIAGYLIVATQDQARQLDQFSSLLRKLPRLRYSGKALTTYKTLIGIQGVVAKQYRGHGVAERLHRAASCVWGAKYELLVSEASAGNTRSLHVHVDKIGWEPIQRHRKNAGIEGNNWLIIVYNLRKQRFLKTTTGS